MDSHIVLLPGDGIGPEVVQAGQEVLETIAKIFGHRFTFETRLIGGAALDASGQPLPPDTLAACRNGGAILLGAVGGPRWDDPSARVRPEQGLLAIRRELGLFANLRPVKVLDELRSCSPLRPELLQGVDLLIVRELTGGAYFGKPQGTERSEQGERAVDTMAYTDHEVRRIVRLACEIAQRRRGKLCSIDKANVLESSRLWRRIAIQTAADFPGVALEHALVDSAAMRLVSQPASFDVIVTENLFGDILSDEAAVLSGALGLLPSASLGAKGPGLFEPVHGSAPDIAGRGIANPVGTILSVAMLLEYGLDLVSEARAVESAVKRVFQSGLRTADLKAANAVTTKAMTRAVTAALDELH